MIERVHEHLTSELRQNTRTDTIFILVAILLNLVILAVNSVIAGEEGDTYDVIPTLSEGSHELIIEMRTEEDWDWQRVGKVEMRFAKSSSTAGGRQGAQIELPEKPIDIRYQLDSDDEAGWAVASERNTRSQTNTVLMFVYILLQVFVNVAVILGLLKGKKMRLVILDGLLKMYKDQNVDMYYSESMLQGYSIRYYIFISIVVFIGVISIAIPLIMRFL